ncbi:MAG: energy transducer TonB [Candidatus Amulumruptor caecigallinarius]|uniref:Energy transducer TonB n=1 Tax=Candidatus Amulumruptor caecigallinarius TaxID=2109911 RepID=A0A4Q0UBA6_9BACT|nr:MAG: energy transducer TonB [Candidatus Amulumruptor caecigallinarius]HJE39623.1 energy transducer TonB [Candidatus Amulumruptor caecigallinarius]
MSKDVDLSSREWRDMIFEGKNKEYGAYEMRAKSDSRHNRAMLVIIIVLFAVAILAWTVNTVIEQAQARPEDTTEQAMVEMATDDVQEEEPQEEEPQRVEEQKPEVLPEEVLNTMKATELKITADAEVKEEIKSQDEMKETTTAVGATDFDKGTDDLNVVREHKDEVVVEEKTEPVDDNKVFDVVEQNPVFPGGEAALLKYVAEHIRYPAMAQENNIQGRVVVQFVVTKTGSIGQVKVVRSKDPDLDKEAVRVVKSLPKFTPGKMNGHAVNVWYTLPINFKLQGV